MGDDIQAKWRECFDQFDADKSGEISARELVNVLLKFGQSDDDAKANAHHILSKTDKNDDGKISWDEFRVALEAGF